MARKQSSRRRQLEQGQSAEGESQAQSNSRAHNATRMTRSVYSTNADSHSSDSTSSSSSSFEWVLRRSRSLILAHWIGCAIAIAMLEHFVIRTIAFSYVQDIVKLTSYLPTVLLPSLMSRFSEIFWPDQVEQLLLSWMHADMLRCDARPFLAAPNAQSAYHLAHREQSLSALFRMYLRDHPSDYDAPVMFAALMIDRMLMAMVVEVCLLVIGWIMLWLTDFYSWFFTPFIQYVQVMALKYQQRQQQEQQKYYHFHHHHHHHHRQHTHSYAYRDARNTDYHIAVDTNLYKQTICFAQQIVYYSIACTIIYYTIQSIELHLDAMRYDAFLASSEHCLPIYYKLNRLSHWRLVSYLILALVHAIFGLVALIKLCITLATGFSLPPPSEQQRLT